MKTEDMQKITNSIVEKIGNENASKIADDLGLIITDNTTLNNTITDKENVIKNLTADKEKLIMANANLLQQVSFKQEDKKEETEPKKIVFKDFLDERGNFK